MGYGSGFTDHGTSYGIESHLYRKPAILFGML